MAYEDFKNDYIEVDPATYINADTADTRANFVDIPLNIECYFYRDFGIAHFGNFTHLIDFYLDIVNGSATSLCAYSVGTTFDDIAGQSDAFQVLFRGDNTPPVYEIVIRDASDVDSDSYLISLDTTYYLKCIRNGTAWSVEIYDAALREVGDLLDTIAVTGTATAFRYVLAAQADNEAAGDRKLTGWMENLDLQEAVVSAPTGTILGPLFGPLGGPI